MKTKTFEIETTGNLPTLTKMLVEKYNGKPATKISINELEYEIYEIVKDWKESHGNIEKCNGYAWLSPRNGNNSFNVEIKF